MYNIPAAVRLVGQLDVKALGASLNEIVRRHEVLRTTFVTFDSLPTQKIVPSLNLALPIIDLSEDVGREEQARRLATQEAQRSFDLAQGPLMRATLLKLTDRAHILLLTMHHIVADGWSTGVFIRELGQLYKAFKNRQPASLPELSVQYADYAAWQREWLREERLEALSSYWREQLRDLPVFELSADYTRPAIQSFRGARHVVQFPAALTQGVHRLCQQQATTLFITLLAAFKALLYRYTGQPDIVVGAPIANRNRPEIEGLIGFFVNMVVLRTNFSGQPTFREFLGRVRQVALDAYAHLDLPFEKLVEMLQPQRDMSRSPLFQIMFVLQNAPDEVIELPELRLHPLPAERGAAQFDLSLHIFESAEGLKAVFEYNTDLFEKQTIERLACHYQILLEAIVADPEQRLSDLPLLTEVERSQMSAWNETQMSYSHDQCLHHLIEAQVVRTPDAVAVVCQGEHLTYDALNWRGNQLGRYLQARNLARGKLIGIFTERSLEMLVGLLGVLKAGGAYVPLDPAYPEERLAFIIQDARLSALLTQQRLLDQVPLDVGQIICLDRDWEALADQDRTNLTDQVWTDDLAYAIYTSGSTGRPKGVMISHNGAVNFMESMCRQPGLAERDCLLAVTTLCFDIAALELFLPLAVGARIELVSRQVAGDGARLKEALDACQATVMQATPATWRLLLEVGWRANRGFRVLCGGEALPWDLASWLSRGNAHVWNLYGPTEATIWATTWRVRGKNKLGMVPIGWPIANIQTYVLDRYQQPAPIGVPGELYIGGVGLAWGYLNRANLTAEKFIPNPFSNEPGERLYRTGDLVRYLPDGNVAFIGRTDHQVKIRGFRIELGEIEVALRVHPVIREAVAAVWDGAQGDKFLVAYIVSEQEPVPSVSKLRDFLGAKLPDYMVPGVFINLGSLPLTPNGKVNRRALPEPQADRPELETAFVAPDTATEKELVEIWTGLLPVKRVGVYDNFFDLGGHSLMATQMVGQIRIKFGIELPLRECFTRPTVKDLAEIIEEIIVAESNWERLEEMLNVLDGISESEAQNALLPLQSSVV
jgi:amino acid adenylation domain-containing protein